MTTTLMNPTLATIVAALPEGVTAEYRAAGGGLEERLALHDVHGRLLCVAGFESGTFLVTETRALPKPVRRAIGRSLGNATCVWVSA